MHFTRTENIPSIFFLSKPFTKFVLPKGSRGSIQTKSTPNKEIGYFPSKERLKCMPGTEINASLVYRFKKDVPKTEMEDIPSIQR